METYSTGLARYLLLIFVLFSALRECYFAYVPPSAVVEPLYPRGIRISLPDEDGITLVAYHVKFNDDFYSLEAGTIAVDIIKKRNGRWVYEDRSTKLKEGDIVYYWVHVVYEGLGYNLLDQQHVVKEFFNYDGTPVQGTGTDTPSTGCQSTSETEVIEGSGSARHPCSGDLIFDENFDTLNTSRWTVIERFSGEPDYEFVVYKNSEEIVEVKDGNLHIKPVLVDDKYGAGFVRQGSIVLDKCTGNRASSECHKDAVGSYILPPVVSGRLNTKDKFNFKHGRIVIRAKLPRGDWIYPLLSLESKRAESGDADIYHEIRIAGSTGNTNLHSPTGKEISGHVLNAGGFAINVNHSQVQRSDRLTLPSKRSDGFWSDTYHTYEIEWKRGRIITKVDGDQYGAQPISGSFDKPFYLNLGVAVGGYGEFPDLSTNGTYVKPWRNIGSKAAFNFYVDRDNWLPSWRTSDINLHVDSIKVYAL